MLLDDLHWADASSLRVLGLLLESLHNGRVTLVATWRDKPTPTGALAGVVEQLSRRHALRLRLTGLDVDHVIEVVEAVSSRRPDPGQADALRARTDGNPFFLVEYARLVDDDADLAALLAEPDPPQAVTDVVRRRLERLPDSTRGVLATAAVVGRAFDLDVVGAASDTDEDALLDALDVATAAGLVREDDVGSFRFAHALVRDTVYADISPTRRARRHAQVAAALAGRTGRAGEVARHWHAAGAGHAAEAWRADRTAAHEALAVYAFEESVGFLDAAVIGLGGDPEATDRDEYDVLVELAQAHKDAGDWTNLRAVVHRAVAVADRMSDPVALARAAIMPSTDALWQSVHHGQVDPVMVAALRRALDELPHDDNELRCRTMLALAGELYYAASVQEREALAEEAVAIARRLGDPLLLMSTCQNAYVTIWRPATSHRRAALAQEALEIAERLGDARALTYAQCVRASSASELGEVDLLETLVAAARQSAEEQRNLYVLVVLDCLDVSWLSMRGEDDLAAARTEHLAETGRRMSLAQQADALTGAFMATHLWRGDYAEILPALQVIQERGALPVDPSVLMMMAYSGLVDEAHAWLAEHEPDLGSDSWFSLLPWAHAAEAAAALGDRALGERAYRLLAPHADMMGAAGSGVAVGPVEGFLALAASAAGERDIAAAHADRALVLARAWRLPLVERRLLDQRERYGY